MRPHVTLLVCAVFALALSPWHSASQAAPRDAVEAGQPPTIPEVAVEATPIEGVENLGDPSPARPQPAREAVNLLSSQPQAIEVEVRFDAPELVEVQREGTIYRYPAWSGMSSEAEPGAPLLPTHTLRIALPPEGTPRLDVQVIERGRLAGLRFPPAPTPRAVQPRVATLRTDPDGTMLLVEGEAYAEDAALPFAELISVGVERGVRVATVVVRPVQWNPRTGDAAWIESARIAVQVTGASGGSAVSGPGDPTQLDVRPWQRNVINPTSAAAWTATAADPVCAPLPEVWFDDTPGWVKISIAANGVYRLDRRSLELAGVPVNTVDPQTFRLYAGPLLPEVSWGTVGWDSIPFAGGKAPTPGWRHMSDVPGLGFTDVGIGSPGGLEQVALWVPGEENGSFDPGEGVVFYALGPDNYYDRFGPAPELPETYLENPYSNHTVYWLSWGDGLPGAPLRMSERDAAPGSGPRVTDSLTRYHVEENELYDPAMYEDGYAWQGWFWEFLTSGSSGQRFLIDLPHLVADTEMSAGVRLWGGQRPLLNGGGQEDLHHVRMTLNGALVPSDDGDLHIWGGGLSRSFTPYDIATQSVAAQSPASFVFSVLKVGNNPDRFDMVYLTYLDISYRRELHADGAPAEFEIDAGSGRRTLRVAGAPSGTPWVFSVDGFRNPVRLTSATSSGGALEFSVEAPATVVAVTSSSQVRTPAKVERFEPPRNSSGNIAWLRDTSEPVDYVIITHRDFTDAAEQLATFRRQNLYGITDVRPARVRVVTVDQIMAEYAYGMYDPVALRYFLETAYRCYGEGEDRPTYAVFLGDHSYDFRDFEEAGVVDYVPSWEDNRDSISGIVYGNTQYVTDDYLARFDGQRDLITDLYIGRIPVSSAAEARALVKDKIIASEASPDRGPWRAKAIMCADDVCQGRRVDALGFTHMAQTERIITRVPEQFDVERVYLYEYGEDCDFDTKPEAKRAFLTAWNEGAWLVNYIGHGGDVVMADEQVMGVNDVALLTNHNRLPVMGSFSCSVGKFSKPLVQGLGEALLRAPTTGTIVSAAATHLTISSTNESSNASFIQNMFDENGDPVAIGVALMRAKRTNTREGHKYVCLGDPASRLTVPDQTLDLDGPSFLQRGATVAYVMEGGAGVGDGLQDVVARDAEVEVTRNSKGETFREHADRLAREYGRGPGGVITSYQQRGPVLYRGRASVSAGSGEVTFTVPASLRGGASGKVRAYAWGESWDGMGTVLPVEVGGTTVPSDDQAGPEITFGIPSGNARPGQAIPISITDTSGLNLTQLFDFRSILLKVLDERGVEQLRIDLTDRFEYGLGSHTAGQASFVIPDLPPARYTFVVSAFDNLNNRGSAALELDLSGGSGGGGMTDLAAYPNPFNPDQESTQILFTLTVSARVSVQVFSVAGRKVYADEIQASAGRNAITWSGRDSVQDLVANGVYLVQITATPDSGGEPLKHLERVVVFR